MGRKINVVDASLRTWYTPDIDDNREDPDPFQVLISPLSGKEMRQLRSSLKLNSTSLESEDIMQAAEQREEELKSLVVSRHVHGVKGYEAQHAGTGEVIEPKNGEELIVVILEAHPDELLVLMDIYEAIYKSSTLSDEAKKKQVLQLDSQSQETQEGNPGVAQNVEEKNIESKTGCEASVIATAIPLSGPSVTTGSRS